MAQDSRRGSKGSNGGAGSRAGAAGGPQQFNGFSELTSFIWSVADILRGDYKQADYGKVILPLTVLRRLDCVLKDTKAKVLKKHAKLKSGPVHNVAPILNRVTGVPFHNVSPMDFEILRDDPTHIAANLRKYIKEFSPGATEIIERFKFDDHISKLDESNLLYQVVGKFAEVDLHPSRVTNTHMGSIFEELIRRFAEASNETAGEHFTPREVIRLMVNLLLTEDRDTLTKPGIVKTLFDPACGTGGMLSVAEEYVSALNPDARLEVFGQELNDESFAICKSDMMIKGQNPENIKRGNSFSEDGHEDRTFDYMLSNPPFGVEWKKVERVIRDEADRGHNGRFGAGLPRINDGSLLFLMHMLSKRKRDKKQGSRIAIVFNGSPLFTGDAGSGESDIRRWIIEQDWLEAIVALPDQLFYNTGIHTYIWIISNRKARERQGKVQLINGVSMFQKMRKSLGNKRHELGQEHIDLLTRLYGDFTEADPKLSKIFQNEEFGFHKITVERPLRLDFAASPERVARLEDQRSFQSLAKSRKKGAAARKDIEAGEKLQAQIRAALTAGPPKGLDPDKLYEDRDAFTRDLKRTLKAAKLKLPAPVQKAIAAALSERSETAPICTDKKGNPDPDTDLRDTESVPLIEDIKDYVAREVLPHVPDAWVDTSKTKVGYEIPFTRHFYEYKPLRPLEDIEAEIRNLEQRIQGMLSEVIG